MPGIRLQATILFLKRYAFSVISHVIVSIGLGFAAGIQPGPFQAFLVSRALQDGWRHALPAAFAPLLSDVLPVTLSLALLTSLPRGLDSILSMVGGAFVLFLAYGAYRSFRSYSFNSTTLLYSRRRNFFKAVTVNLLNPNPYLFWSLVMGPLVLAAWTESSSAGVAMVGVFYGSIVATSLAIIVGIAGVGRLFPRINRVLLGLSALVMGVFGVYQLYHGASSLWL